MKQRKQWVLAIAAVDVVFIAVAIWWFMGRMHGAAHPAGPPPSADVQVNVRRVRPKLMEIDLVNNGTADGPMNRAITVTWADGDLVQSQALPGFDRSETGRRNVQFHPGEAAAQKTLAPGAVYEVGWIELTEDEPVQAQLAEH